MVPHKYTQEQANFIAVNIRGKQIKQLTQIFNCHFGLNIKHSQIRAFVKNHGLKSGVNTRFSKGHVPANKGRKGVDGWKPTQFKKGHRPLNYKPIGSERVKSDGYVDVKIADCKDSWKRWKGKHILIWEKHHGPVPRGHVVIFGDGNNRNFDINNLILVSRQQLLILNRNNLIQNNADLTRTGVIIADLHKKVFERKRGALHEHKR